MLIQLVHPSAHQPVVVPSPLGGCHFGPPDRWNTPHHLLCAQRIPSLTLMGHLYHGAQRPISCVMLVGHPVTVSGGRSIPSLLLCVGHPVVSHVAWLPIPVTCWESEVSCLLFDNMDATPHRCEPSGTWVQHTVFVRAGSPNDGGCWKRHKMGVPGFARIARKRCLLFLWGSEWWRCF